MGAGATWKGWTIVYKKAWDEQGETILYSPVIQHTNLKIYGTGMHVAELVGNACRILPALAGVPLKDTAESDRLTRRLHHSPYFHVTMCATLPLHRLVCACRNI